MAYIITVREVKTEVKHEKRYMKTGEELKKEQQCTRDHVINTLGWVEGDFEDKIDREVFSQRVEELDLASVVKAINRL